MNIWASTTIPRHSVSVFWLLLLCLASALPAQDLNNFGSTERLGGAFIGIFYDLKQTQQRAPIPNHRNTYGATVNQLVASGFDESLFNRFFRASRPLYTTQFSIPKMNADSAPKAFGVEGVVEPRYWIIHYRAQVAPPEDGTYRFVGNMDDVMVVTVNQKVVLNASLGNNAIPVAGWRQPDDHGPSVAADGGSKYGDWLTLKAGQPVDLDIIIGERPGGRFGGFLLYQKKGEDYPLNSRGEIILPLFQIAPRPDTNRSYLTDRPAWTSFP